MPPEPLSAFAPAKVNLVLEVTARRPDGYHEIDTVLQTLALADRVTVSRGPAAGLTATGPFAAGVPLDDSNLAWRAAQGLARRAGESTAGLSIALEKRIPPAGGLGGGASDAATTLRLLAQWWPGATEAALREVAAAVGSDETFFLAGGTARAQGRGELVTPLPPLTPHGVVLFIPHQTIDRKTGRMFAALASHPFDRGGAATAFATKLPPLVRSVDVFNAFERVAFDVFDGLAALWEQLEALVGEPVRLAGAGPTLFWIGPPGRAANVAARAAAADCTIIETTTAESLWRR